MIYKYELACKEAGLSEEQIKEIRQMFDNDKKQLKREKEYMSVHNIGVFSPDAVQRDGEIIGYVVPDQVLDIEAEIIKKAELVKLNQVLQFLSEDEREFLSVCYEDAKDSDTRIAEILDIPRQTVQYRKRKLLKKIRGLYKWHR